MGSGQLIESKPMPAPRQPLFVGMRNLLDRVTGAEVALKGGISTAGVVRVGETVRRPMTENSVFVHDLLRYLEVRGFTGAPRFLGVDEKGRAILTYVQGEVHHRLGGFREEQWRAAAKLLKLFHDTTEKCGLRGGCEVICHGDASPGNYVFRDDLPVGLIDFDSARPGKREDDVGYAAWMWLHIGDPRLTPEEQGAKLVDFVVAYDAAATWNPLDIVLEAQYALLRSLPSFSLKWAFVKQWAHACTRWTEKNREAVSAGIAMRSANPP